MAEIARDEGVTVRWYEARSSRLGLLRTAFTLAPAATVDEGNNWINMFYGPLSYANSTLTTTPGAGQTPLGNYNHTGPIGAAPYSVNPQ